MNFEEAEARLFATTDDILGDVIWVKIPPGGFVERKGFVGIEAPEFNSGGLMDALKTQRRVKLSKTYFPAEPDRSVRIQSAKLGPGVFQIAGDIDGDGHNYMFDVQEAGD